MDKKRPKQENVNKYKDLLNKGGNKRIKIGWKHILLVVLLIGMGVYLTPVIIAAGLIVGIVVATPIAGILAIFAPIAIIYAFYKLLQRFRQGSDENVSVQLVNTDATTSKQDAKVTHHTGMYSTFNRNNLTSDEFAVENKNKHDDSNKNHTLPPVALKPNMEDTYSKPVQGVSVLRIYNIYPPKGDTTSMPDKSTSSPLNRLFRR